MIHVDRVFQLELPVAAEHVFVDAGAQIDLTVRRPIDQLVNAVFGRAKVILQTGSLLCEACKYKAPAFGNPRNASHSESGVVCIEALAIASSHRDRFEIAIRLERPAVVAAAKYRGVALVFVANNRTAMTAAVEDHIDFAIRVTRHDERLVADSDCDVVACVRHQALMAHIDPGSSEYPRHLQIKHVRVEIKRSVDVIAMNERTDGLRIGSHYLAPRLEAAERN